MHGTQAQALLLVGEIHDAERRHAISGAATGQAESRACIRTALAPADGADEVAARHEDARRVAVQHEVVAADVRGQRRRADRTGAAEPEPVVVLADADQVGVAERIDLQAADEEHPAVPVLDLVEAVPAIAEGLGPAHDPVVPAEGGQRDLVEMVHVHARAKEHELHVRAVHEVREAHGGLRDRQRDPDLQFLAVVQIAGKEAGEQFGDRAVLCHRQPQYSCSASRRLMPTRSR